MLTHAPPELHRVTASMKVPPKRKGNCSRRCGNPRRGFGLNESPSEKEGKSGSSELSVGDRVLVGGCG